MNVYDDLVQRMRTNTRGLSLLTNDILTVLPEERDALDHVNRLVESWSIEDRRRR